MSTSQIPLPDDTPPDGGYGWVCVGSCFLLNFSTWGAVAVSASFYLDARFAYQTSLMVFISATI
jgi:hypothetical protein